VEERPQDPVPSQPPGLGVPAKEWEDAWIAVLLFAFRVTKSPARADDIRQEAYLRLLTTRRWTSDGRTPFLRHMLLVASSILTHENKARHRREKRETDSGAEYKRDRGVVTQSPEQHLFEVGQDIRNRERAVRVLAELRRRLAGFPLELRIIDRLEQAEASDQDFETPAELAKALGVGVEEVYRARARIRRYKESVYAAVDGGGEESE
jgi:DNA-directed RNA polymerase specialized sigma24 family protein